MTEADVRRQVLALLQQKGRAPLDELAAAIGCDPSAVQRALEWLEEEGVITGFHASVDYHQVGLGLTALIMVKVAGEHLTDVRDRMGELPNFTDVYEITGEFDLVAIGRFANNDGLNRVIKEILALRGVRATNTSLVLGIVKASAPVDVGGAGGALPSDRLPPRM